MKTAPLLIVCAIALSACDTPVGTDIARDQAKSVVNQVVEDKYPSLDLTPATDCIIDQASGNEILTIASAAVTGVTQRTTHTVLEIAGRKGTIECFIREIGPQAMLAMALGGS